MSLGSLGSLVVSLETNMASFASDMGRASQVAEDFGRRVAESAEMAKRALEGIGIGLGALEFKEMIAGAIETADQIERMSQKIGMSVEQLGAFRLMAAQSDVSMDQFATSVKKLSTYMVEHNDRLKEAGVVAEDAQGALLQVADIFHDMPDGPLKTAAAVQLFGRAGLDMIPILNKGSEEMQALANRANELNPITAEAAKRAEEFKEKLAEGQLASSRLAQTIASGILPTLTTLVDTYIQYSKEGGNVAAISTGIAEAFKAIVVLGANVVYTFAAIGDTVGGLGAQVVALVHGDFAAVDAINEAIKTRNAEMRASIEVFSEEILHPKIDMSGIEKALDDAMFGEDPEKAAKAAQQKLQALMGQADAAKQAQTAYDNLINSIKAKIAIEDAEIANGGKLTAAQQMRIEMESKLQAMLAKYPSLNRQLVDGLVAESAANLNVIDSNNERNRIYEETYRLWVKGLEAIQKQTQSVEDDTQKIRDHNTELVAGKSALEDVKIARDNDTIAILNAKLARIDETNQCSAEADAIRAEIAALQDHTKALQEAINANNFHALQADWKKLTDFCENSLENALMAGFNAGKSFGQNFVDSLKHTLETAALKVVVNALVNTSMSNVGQALGITSASGTTGELNGLGNLLSTGSGLYQGYAGFTSGSGTGLLGSVGNYLGGYGWSGAGTALGSGWATVGGDAALTGLGTSTGLGGSTAIGIGSSTAVSGLGTGTAVAGLGEGTAAAGIGTGAAAGAGMAEAGGMTAAMAIPYIGWAIAAIAAIAALTSKSGGPKQEGDALYNLTGSDVTYGGSEGFYTGHSADAQMQTITQASALAIENTIKALGGTGTALGVRLGFNTDPQGTAPDNISGTVQDPAGNLLYQHTYDAGRGSYGTELQTESKRVMLAAIEASDVPAAIKNAIGSMDSIKALSSSDADTIFANIQALATALHGLNGPLADAAATFHGTTAETLAYVQSLAQIQQFADADPFQTVLEASKSVASQWLEQGEQLQALAQSGTASTVQLATAAQARYALELQLVQQIAQVQTSTNSMFADSIRSMTLAPMSNEQQYAFLGNEIAQKEDALRTLTDPTLISQYASTINSDINQSYGLLSPDQQTALNGDFIKQLNDAQTLVNDRLAAASTQVAQDQKDSADYLKNAVVASAAQITAAAAATATALATPQQVTVTITSPLPTEVTYNNPD